MACALQLSLPAVLSNLPQMLALVDTACERIGVPPDAAYDVRLAVDEMCTNVISHGYEGLPTGPMSRCSTVSRARPTQFGRSTSSGPTAPDLLSPQTSGCPSRAPWISPAR